MRDPAPSGRGQIAHARAASAELGEGLLGLDQPGTPGLGCLLGVRRLLLVARGAGRGGVLLEVRDAGPQLRDGGLGPGPGLRVGPGPLASSAARTTSSTLRSRFSTSSLLLRGTWPTASHRSWRARSVARAALWSVSGSSCSASAASAFFFSRFSPDRRRARRTPRTGRRRRRPGRPGTVTRARPRRRDGPGRRPSTGSSARGRPWRSRPQSLEVESSSAFLMSRSLT